MVTVAAPGHGDERDTGVTDHGSHVGVGAATAHVVDDLRPASSAADAISARIVSMLTTAPAATDRVRREQPPDLLGTDRCARDGWIATDVDDVGAVVHQRHAPGDRRLGVEERAAVGDESGVTLTTPMTSSGSARQVSRQPARWCDVGINGAEGTDGGRQARGSPHNDEAHLLGAGRRVAELARTADAIVEVRAADAPHRHAQVLALTT